MDKITKNVLEEIEEKQIEPKAAWMFRARNIGVWVLGIVSIVFGAVAVATSIHILDGNDVLFFAQARGANPRFLFTSLPYIWIVVFVLFILLAQYEIRHTKKAYKIPLWQLVLGVLGASVVLGAVLHFTGVGKAIDYALEERSENYGRFLAPRHRGWVSPEDGVIGGKIIELSNGKMLEIETIEGDVWDLDISNADVKGTIEENRLIHAIGEKTGNNSFVAEKVMVQKAGRPFGQSGKQPPRPPVRK